MRNNPIVKNTIAAFKENELIAASKVYREKLSKQISEAAYYKTLQRMCDAGELVKIAKGTYHLPKKSKYGIVPPSEKEIVRAFTENETGVVVGYHLYNTLDLTTQISKKVNVMSSSIEGATKTVRNVVVVQVPLRFSIDVKNIVQGLEVLQNFSTIQDMNYSAFLTYARKIADTFDESAFEEVMSARPYKKSTVSFYREILNYYDVENDLGKYLSNLSKYKHPSMEEIYEAARISQRV